MLLKSLAITLISFGMLTSASAITPNPALYLTPSNEMFPRQGHNHCEVTRCTFDVNCCGFRCGDCVLGFRSCPPEVCSGSGGRSQSAEAASEGEGL
ncbi:unnamed protein product [Cercospora beticola]|nr:unnamed protein product [Cercospora beticola]